MLMNRPQFKFLTAFIPLAIVPNAQAEVFIELFTAKSCAVCEQAEVLVEELSLSDNVIAVAMHVDYWDYVEKDPISHPAFGARQVGYNKIGDLKELFTPQIVFQGEEKEVSGDFEAMFQVIDNYTAPELSSAMIEAKNGQVKVNIDAMDKLPENPLEVIWMRFYSDEELNAIEPNSAQGSMSNIHQVKLIRSIGEWTGEENFQSEFEIESPARGVLIVQEHDLGKVLFAKLVDIPAP